MLDKILYTKPSITELEINYVNDAITNGWGEKCYEYIHKFEHLFKEHLGSSFTIATSSCTGAMHMGLSALNIGPGDEVILADTNWIATVAPIVHLGAKPVFIDILEDSWCIDPDNVEAVINSNTKAIIATHLYGNLCEMKILAEIAEKHGVYLIEDSAEAIGSSFEGKKAGTMGIFGVFSFHGSKTVTTGEGGIFTTNDKVLYEKVLTLSNHGRSKSQAKQFFPDLIGFKYKISNVQAAIGCGQLERIAKLISRKIDILNFYRNELEDFGGIRINFQRHNCIIGGWMSNIVFSKESKVLAEDAKLAFGENNIDGRVFFYPLSSLPMFKGNKINKKSLDIHNRAINLPSFHDIKEEELIRVVKTVKSLIK